MKRTSTLKRVILRNYLLHLLTIAALFLSQPLLAHDVTGYNASCVAGPKFSIDPIVANVNNSSNYAWQYKNSSNAWVCIVNGNNTINGNTYNVSGATSTATINPAPIIFNNPNSGLHGLVIRCVISDGSGVNPCNLPSGNTYNSGSSSSVNQTIHLNNTPCTSSLALGNRVWYDTNNDGINNGENGIANVTVRLYKDDNNDNTVNGAAIATETTDANGYYLFENLVPGNYIVGVVTPAGYMSSSVNGGDPDNDVNLDDNGQVTAGTETRGLAITLAAGTEPDGTNTNTNTNGTYDFGFLPDCNCVTSSNNLLVNGSFENGTTGWGWSGGTLTTGTGFVACGIKNGFNDWSSGTSKVYQDVDIAPGATVTFKAFAGTHTAGLNCSPKLSLIFLSSTNAVLHQEDVAVTRDVDVNFNQLAQYTITEVAPAGTDKVRVQSSITCDVMKIDAFCLTTTCVTPGTPSASVTHPTCNVATGSVTLSGLPSSGNWTLTRNPGNVVTTGSGTTTTVNGLATGTYSFVVANSGGCTSAAVHATIGTQPASPATPTATITHPTCAVATGSITITGPTGTGITYSFDNGAYSTTTTYGNLAAGSTHTVEAKNAAGCESPVLSLTIGARPAAPATPTATITHPTCAVSTGSITITGPTGSGITYSFDNGAYSTTTTYNNLAAGSTHTIEAKNAAGCESPALSLTIGTQPASPATPTATITHPTCAVSTGSITITGPTGSGITYSFDGGAYSTTTTYNNLAAGSTHTIKAKNTAGCESSVLSVTIGSQPATPATPTATVTHPTCAVSTGSITITAPTGSGITYSFDGGAYSTTTTYGNLAAGSTHTIKAKNAAGCESPALSLTIGAQPATPAAPTVTKVDPTCNVATGSITITAPTGSGITYSFDGGAYSTTTTYSNLAAGSTHTIKAKNAAGCESPATSITIGTQPARATVGDFVWIDANINGLIDGIDLNSPLSGILVSIYNDADANGNPDGPAISTFTTLVNGKYSFTNLCPGKYVLQFGTKNGYARTTQLNTGSKDASDSDPNQGTGFTPTVTLTPGENDPTVDAGYYSTVILPVNFGTITAQARDCQVQISFDVLTQQNTKQFVIEYSKDGAVWGSIGTIAAAGTTANARTYSFTHTQPVAGNNLYRIKSIDADGKTTFSNTISARSNCAGKGSVVSYPNPVHDVLTVILPAHLQEAQLQFYNGLGQLIIADGRKSGLMRTVNLTNLSPGMYIMKVMKDGQVVMAQKVVKGE